MVPPAPVRIQVWPPRYGQWMHPEIVLEPIRRVERILPSRARYDAVVASVCSAEAVAQVAEFAFALGPLDSLLALRHTTGRADPIRVEGYRLLRLVGSVAVFDTRIRTLV